MPCFLRLAISLSAAAFYRAGWGRLVDSLKEFGAFDLFRPLEWFPAEPVEGGEQCPASLRWCGERASASCAM